MSSGRYFVYTYFCLVPLPCCLLILHLIGIILLNYRITSIAVDFWPLRMSYHNTDSSRVVSIAIKNDLIFVAAYVLNASVKCKLE